MEFGKIYTFPYKKGNDKKPVIIFIGEDKDQILGVNLHYLHHDSIEEVLKLFNYERLKDLSFNDPLVEKIIADNKEIDIRKYAKKLLGKDIKISHRNLLLMLQKTLRVYDIKNEKNVVELTQKEILDQLLL